MIKSVIDRSKMVHKTVYFSFDSAIMYYVQKGIILTEKIKYFLWRYKK